MRNQRGFTLIFAVILCVVFAGLLFSIYYFLRLNVLNSQKNIYEQQARYLAESGNNRAMSMLNVKLYPDIEEEEVADKDDEDDDDFFDEDWDDEDFEDFFEEDDFFDDEDWDDEDDDEFNDDSFLTNIPRYINFYHKEPYYVNIDTGSVITQSSYFAMIQQQQQRIEVNKASAAQNGYEYEQSEILVEELYFPLPEVNVKNIGMIPVEKGVHLKPGYKVQLSQKMPIDLKRDNIVDEYFNYIPEYTIATPKPILRNMTPNFATQGEYLTVYLDGENIDDLVPVFSTPDITVFDSGSGNSSIGLTEKAKTGRYQVRIGKFKTDFYIVPHRDGSPNPRVNEVRLKERDETGNNQFIKMNDKDEVKGLTIIGENLSINGAEPLVVPDSFGIKIDVVSFQENEIVINISTDQASIGAHYLSVFTKGGQSGSWIFNVNQGPVEVPEDPDTGSFSTLLTLLEVNSLSNLPFSSVVEASSDGRPESTGANGRPGSSNKASKNAKKFDLLKSDLELVWKLETIATVNKQSFKETRIVRRNAPRIEAAIATTSDVSFGQSSIQIQGQLEALTRLEESSTSGDTVIFVEGQEPYQEDFESRDDRPALAPTGSAVVEDFNFSTETNSPAAKGFKKGGLISIVSFNRSSSYSDTAFVKELGQQSITVEEPGFESNHYIGDEVIQFTPSIISPEEISEREAERSLDPPGSYANLPGKTKFDYVFRTSLEKIEHWAQPTSSTSVPNDLRSEIDGYFGLNIIKGTPSYTGGNSLYGQGTLVIDTTENGFNPSGSTVVIGGSSKLPSIFDGVIYILGNLQISGPVEISGGIVVHSPSEGSTIRIAGSGNVSYNEKSIQKAIIHIPFTEELRTRVMERSKGQEEIIQKEEK